VAVPLIHSAVMGFRDRCNSC